MSLEFILGSLFGFGTFFIVLSYMQNVVTKATNRQLDALNRFADEFHNINSSVSKDSLK